MKSRPESRKRWMAGLTGALVVALIGVAPLAANANSFPVVPSDLHVGEYQLLYGTARYHSTASGASFNLTNVSPGFCGSALGLGLRNTATGDSTFYQTWTGGGSKSFTWWNGSGTLPVGYYAFNAHNRGGGNCGYSNISWSGTLNF